MDADGFLGNQIPDILDSLAFQRIDGSPTLLTAIRATQAVVALSHGQYAASEELLISAIENSDVPDLRMNCMILFMFQKLHLEGNRTVADSVLAEIYAQFPEHEETPWAQEVYDVYIEDTLSAPPKRNRMQETAAKSARTAFDVSAYPNPFTDFIRVAFNTNDVTPDRIEVYDLLGRLLHNEQIKTGNTGAHTTTLRLPNLLNGTYLLILRARGRVVAGKLIAKQNRK